MRNHLLSCTVFACGLIAMAAQADHNSIWNEGWANMPNDIHNARVETMDEDTATFVDYVRMGSGSEAANPDMTGSDAVGGSDPGGGSRNQAGTRGGRS